MALLMGSLMRLGRLSRSFPPPPRSSSSSFSPSFFPKQPCFSFSSFAPISSLKGPPSVPSLSPSLSSPLLSSPVFPLLSPPFEARRWKRHNLNQIVEEEVKAFEQAKDSAGSEEYSKFVYNLCMKEKPRLALGYAQEMKRKKLQMNSGCFIKFLHCLFHAREPFFHKKLISEFDYWSTVTDIPTIAFNLPLNVCVNNKNWAKAQEILKLMDERAIEKYESTYNILLQLCVVCRRSLPEAAKLFEQMKEEVQPTTTTYNILFKLCMATREFSQGTMWFEELLRQSPVLNFELDSLLLTNGTLLYFGDGKVTQGLKCFEELRSKTGFVRPPTWYGVVKGCARAQKLDLAFSYLEKMKENGVEPDLNVYNTLLQGIVFAKTEEMYLKGIELFEEMTRRGLSGDVNSFNSLLSGARDFGSLSTMEDLLEEMTSRGILRDSLTYDVLLQGCLFFENTEKAIFFYDEMLKRGISPLKTTKTFKTNQALLAKMYKQQEWANYLKYFELLLQGGFQDHVEAFNMAIFSAKKLNDFEKALFFYEELKQHKEPNINTYNILLEGIDQDDEIAVNLMEDMSKWGISFPKKSKQGVQKMMKNSNQEIFEVLEKLKESGEESSSVYNLALRACAAKKDLQKLCKYFDEAEKKGLVDSLSYSIIIQAYMNTNKQKKALEFFDKMICGGCRVSENLIPVVFSAYSKRKDYESAVKAFDYLQNSPNLTSDGFIRLYSGMINVCSWADKTEEALEYFREMIDRGYTPGLVVYNTVLNCCAHVSRRKELERFFEEIEQNPNLTADAVTYSTMIKGMGRSGDLNKALFYFEEMKRKNLDYKRAKVYGKLIGSCINCKDFEKANHYFNEMREFGMHHPISYESMINTCVHSNNEEKAEKFYREMLENGLKPHSFVYSKLVLACYNGGQYEKAFKYYEEMKERGITVPHHNFPLFNSLFMCAQKTGNTKKFCQIYDEMCDVGIKPIRKVFILLLESWVANRGKEEEESRLIEFALGEMKKYKISGDAYFCFVLSSITKSEKKTKALLSKYEIPLQQTKKKR